MPSSRDRAILDAEEAARSGTASCNGRPAMTSTRNSIHDNARKAAIAALGARMADAIDLALAIKHAHTMAERISQLAGTPQGTLQGVSGATSLPAYPADAKTIEAHLTALADRYGAFANAVRKDIEAVDEAGDPTSADVLTQVSRGVDKSLWFIEAHLPGNT